ncbi:MAG TPA: STAS domain-containing protein [Methanoregulaceae archaeon]|nr:STAS domain-containing protein [Methanoregulaceae archaeon]
MEVTTRRHEGILTFTCNGRLDGFGSGILERSIRDALGDDDRSIVVDLDSVDYLSSAGIRVLLANSKALKKRGGMLALTRVQKYPSQVLDMAGFSSVFPRYPSIGEAVRACQRSLEPDDLLVDILAETQDLPGLKLSIELGSSAPADLVVSGDLQDILHARLVPEKVRTMDFADIAYALGVGAMGSSVDDALPLMGEMVVLHGSIVWLPTDGHDTPDFFTPLKSSDEVKMYTGYAVTLKGHFHEYLTIESKSPEGVTMEEIYRVLFARAKERKRPDCLIAVAMWGICAGLESSGIRKAPVAGSAPEDGRSILDHGNYDEWMAHDAKPRYHGDTLVSFGIGFNPAPDAAQQPKDAQKLLYYRHPGNQPGEGMFLHNQGVVFRNVLYEPTTGLDSQIKKIVTTGEFVDMRHLLDTTRLKKGKVGVAYISGIRSDPASQTPDTLDLFT